MVYLSKPPIHDELLEIFGKRIGLFKGLPWIAVLTYYTIVIAVFKPLRKSIKQLEEEDKKKSEEYSYKYIMHEDDDIEEEK